MNVSIDWIREFVDLPEDVNDELGKKFTLATCEVESVERINSHLKSVFIVQVMEISKHPKADKLNIVTINKGNGETQSLVCGASNVEVNKKVAFAGVGTVLPGGFTLTPKEIRGYLSEGMLCSEVELGIGSDDSGLKIFPDDAPIGVSLDKYLELPEDIIFDIDNKSITHRPDLWAQYGMAREFATVFKKDLLDKFNKDWENKILSFIPKGKAPISVKVEKESACKGYFGLSIDNVVIEESPLWMKKRLISCGVRPINNMVDISNYVMLELGNPTHIFDRSFVKESIVVKRSGIEQKFTTLDEIERDIIENDTLICDIEKPLALAGIMGGLESSVFEDTTSIFVEVANFKAADIRRTSTRLGLRTDASLRFEKTLDSQLLKRSILRILDLIKQLCPDAVVVGSLVYDGENLDDYKPLKIEISCDKIRKVLGYNVEDGEVVDILKRLDFGVENKKGNLTVTVPSYRATKDIECDADIIEEIGRNIGYDNINPVAPLSEVKTVRLSNEKQLHRKIQDFLVQEAKCLEIFTYPMVGEKLLKKAKWSQLNEKLTLVNAISKENDRMRPSLIPTALEAASKNCKTYTNFRFFELGRAYLPNSENFRDERTQLLIAFYDRKNSQILEMINTVEKLISFTNIPGSVKFTGGHTTIVEQNWQGLHPYENIDIKLMGKHCGVIFTVHPSLCSNFKIKGNLTFAVLDLTEVETRRLKDKTKYTPIPKFPNSIFDCTIVTGKETEAINVIKALSNIRIKELESIKIVDIFQLDEKTKSITIRSKFSNPEKTLDGKFLTEAQDKIVSVLEKAGFSLKM